MSMEASIQTLIDKFHRKMENDEQAKEEVMPLKKTVNIDLGTEHYSLKLENAQISDFKPEVIDEADITLVTTPESLQGLIDGTLRPMKAYVTKKITVKGKIQDLMFLKKFF
ncbi:MAG: SCP2 sterol-binding domain-containing protein [Methanomassiliicoccaceae archaeon]|nr:SCP2 sterol-binding domain-containing protein [Methanomassiliicoccaceae archaeon]